jgi:amidase
VEAALSVDHRAEEESYRRARRRDRDEVVSALDAALGQADSLLFRSDRGATWAARSGWPSVTVPVGYSPRSRRPRSVTLVGRAWSETRLLGIAAGVEQAIGRRRPPWEINPAPFARLSGHFGP